MISPENKEKLRQLVQSRCLIRDSSFNLTAGAESSFYFDCKKATLDGECLNLIAEAFLDEIDQLNEKPVAIGGLTLGADFITAAVAMKAFENGHLTVNGSIIRKEPKKHGSKNKIENQLPEGTKVVAVDDVITSGKSIREACVELINGKYELVGMIALVDRKAGGKESLEKEFNVPVRAVFSLDDFNIA